MQGHKWCLTAKDESDEDTKQTNVETDKWMREQKTQLIAIKQHKRLTSWSCWPISWGGTTIDRPACCSSDFSSSRRFKHAAFGLRFRSAITQYQHTKQIAMHTTVPFKQSTLWQALVKIRHVYHSQSLYIYFSNDQLHDLAHSNHPLTTTYLKLLLTLTFMQQILTKLHAVMDNRVHNNLSLVSC